MDFFGLDTLFPWGEYHGYTLEEVFFRDPNYMNNSLLSEDFAISEIVFNTLKSYNPNFQFSEKVSELCIGAITYSQRSILDLFGLDADAIISSQQEEENEGCDVTDDTDYFDADECDNGDWWYEYGDDADTAYWNTH